MGREIRKVFQANDEKLCNSFCVDYSQIELRVLAHMCQDENLIEAFLSLMIFIQKQLPMYLRFL